MNNEEKIIELLTQINKKLDRMSPHDSNYIMEKSIERIKDEKEMQRRCEISSQIQNNLDEYKYRARYNNYCKNQSLLSKIFMGTPTFEEYVLDQESDWC